MKTTRLIAGLALIAGCARPVSTTSPSPSPGNPSTATVDPAELRAWLGAFAADSTMGREAGTIWNTKATDWVAARFQQYGLRAAGEGGGFFQTYPAESLVARSRGRLTLETAIGAPARNVIAIWPGSDPALRNEYVAITAHNDHLGFTHTPVDHDSLRAFNAVVRPRGADDPRRPATDDEMVRVRAMINSMRRMRPPRLDSIFNGADDDGSGTVGLVAIARALAASNVHPRRSILLVSHTAEEKGLLGSAWYTDHSTVPIDSIVAEFDVDMIGRGAATDIKGGGPTYLEVVGLTRLSREFGQMVDAANARQPTPFVFNLEYDAPGHPDQYYCRADHYSYARYGIPSVSLSRGGHRDYHQVSDEAGYIDYEDFARLVRMVIDAAEGVANADHAPRLDGPKPTNPHVRCQQ